MGAGRIKDLTTQLEHLKALETEVGDAYKKRLESMTLYQRALLDDTERALTAIKERRVLDADITAEQKLADKDRIDALAASTAAEQAALKRQEDDHLARVRNLKELKRIQDEITAAGGGSIEALRAQAEKADETSSKMLTQREKQLQIEERLRISTQKSQPEQKKSADLFKSVSGAVAGVVTAVPDMAKSIKDLSAKTAVLTMLMPGTGLEAYRQRVMEMPGEMDTSYRAMVRSGIAHTPEMNGMMNSIIDPIGMIGKEFGTTLESSKRMLTGVGLFAPQTIEALTSVKNNVMLFRKGWIGASDSNRMAAEETTNLIAGLKQLGVATDDSANIVNYFTKGLGKTPAMANDALKSMENMAYSLDINVGQAFKDFIATQDDLAQYGSRNEEVFYNLEAQSVATGIQVTTLSKAAAKLDTFKGAAQAAQGFNAVLGKTVLSVTDLVNAEPAEKIEMLKDAFDRSGMTFETSNRRMKSIVANMLGMGVADASKLFGSKEDYFDISSGMNTTATEVEELEKRIKSSMNVSEKMQASMTNLGEANSRLVKLAREEAEVANNFMLDMFANLKEGTGDSMEALIGYMGEVTAAAKAQDLLIGGVKGAAIGVGALTAIEKMAQGTAFEGAAKYFMYQQELLWKQDLGGPKGAGKFDKILGDPSGTEGEDWFPVEAKAGGGGTVGRTAGAGPGGQRGFGSGGGGGGTQTASAASYTFNIVSADGVVLDSVDAKIAGVMKTDMGKVLPTNKIEFDGYRIIAIKV
jgi:hypothetical protein